VKPPTRRRLTVASGLAAAVVLPGWLGDYTTNTLSRILALGLLAASVAVLTGHAGLPTLGQVAPAAAGAYTTVNLAHAGVTTGPVQVAAATVAGAVFAVATAPDDHIGGPAVDQHRRDRVGRGDRRQQRQRHDRTPTGVGHGGPHR
jgi:hypothetical protein